MSRDFHLENFFFKCQQNDKISPLKRKTMQFRIVVNDNVLTSNFSFIVPGKTSFSGSFSWTLKAKYY